MAYPLRLKVFKGDELVATRDFERDHIRIGRLASAHLTLEDEKVSRIHTVIEATADGVLSILDMGSVEGTFVNGKRVNNKGALAFGDEIRIGNTLLKVESVAETAAANLAAAASGEEAASVASAGEPASSPAGALAQAAEVAAAPVLQTPAAQPEAPAAQAPAPAEPAPTETATATAAPAPAEESATAAPRVRKPVNTRAPLGLSLRFLWGNQILGEYLLQPNSKRRLFDRSPGQFSVGTAPDVWFHMGDAKLGATRFVVAQANEQGYQLRFTKRMVGELERKGEPIPLDQLVASKRASPDGDGYAISLNKDDFAWVDLGGVTVEACFQNVPKPVLVPFADTIDYTTLNIFLLIFFLGAMFVVAALNKASAGDVYADELNSDDARIAKLIIKPPDIQKNAFIKQLNQEKAKKAAAPAKHSGEEGAMGKKNAPKRSAHTAAKATDPNNKDQARMLAQKIFGKGGAGISNIFSDHNGLGGELKAAMGNMVGSVAGESGGLEGLGMKGGLSGGGGTGHTIGIGAVGTKGRAGGNGHFGNGTGLMGGKRSVDIGITSSDPVVEGSLDKELIRKVIHSHVSQIRFCYESEMIKNPKLAGKVAVKFVITASGSVATSAVVQSSTGDPLLDKCVSGRVRTWQFPKPKGGGVVVVTYPFLFKASGE